MNTGNNLPQKSLHLKVLCMFFMTIHNQVLENRRMLDCAFKKTKKICYTISHYLPSQKVMVSNVKNQWKTRECDIHSMLLEGLRYFIKCLSWSCRFLECSTLWTHYRWRVTKGLEKFTKITCNYLNQLNDLNIMTYFFWMASCLDLKDKEIYQISVLFYLI